MSSKAFLTLLTVLSVLASVRSVAAAERGAEAEYHTLPSGRRVPLAALRAHPHFDASATRLVAAQVYEFLPSSGQLSAVGRAPVSLHAHTEETPLAFHANVRVAVNGRSLPDAERDRVFAAPVVRSGSGFSAVFLPDDSHPVSVTLDHADLVPLHFVSHPGVYIATPHTAATHGVAAAPEGSGTSAAAATLSGAKTVRQDANDTETETVTELPAQEEPGHPDMTGAVSLHGAPKPNSTAESNRLLDTAHLSEALLAARQSGPRLCRVFDPRRFLEVAAAFDNTFCAKYGNNFVRAVAAIQASLNSANAAFWSDLCVRAALVQVEAHCADRNDPYAVTRRAQLSRVLNNFRAVWRLRSGGVRRDLAVLFVGYFSPGTSYARGFIDGACSRVNGYGVTERLVHRDVSFLLALALGGAPGRFSIGYSAINPRRLDFATVGRIRRFLQFDGRSWCVTRARRFCNASCPGQCVAGKCVTGVVVLPRRTCAAAASSTRPIVCTSVNRFSYLTPWIDILYISARVQYGRVIVDVEVTVGAILLEIGVRIGSPPTQFSNRLRVSRGSSTRARTSLSSLLEPRAGQSCCGRRVYFTLRIGGCLGGNCGVIRKGYYFTLLCRQVCFGRRTLPMTSFRQCPRCV